MHFFFPFKCINNALKIVKVCILLTFNLSQICYVDLQMKMKMEFHNTRTFSLYIYAKCIFEKYMRFKLLKIYKLQFIFLELFFDEL